ncbi:hypothetical protein HanIR_Chr05g0253611 [Helianthus annuus]|nr:hypothetical protein HanIR_Chr05g0253611 [Helianthus annuus]
MYGNESNSRNRSHDFTQVEGNEHVNDGLQTRSFDFLSIFETANSGSHLMSSICIEFFLPP